TPSAPQGHMAFPTQIHQMGALNINGLPPNSMTPVSSLSSPPANITTSVPSLVTPMVNGFTGIPHQPNGHPAVEAVYTNGLPSYSTQSPSAADTLQQAFTGVQQYTGTLLAVTVVPMLIPVSEYFVRCCKSPMLKCSIGYRRVRKSLHAVLCCVC
uniref:Uncharacterized protein n=1 Tax=Gadus morhua TaxID=8049 RepID=A0A8C5F7B5_GADMO